MARRPTTQPHLNQWHGQQVELAQERLDAKVADLKQFRLDLAKLDELIANPPVPPEPGERSWRGKSPRSVKTLKIARRGKVAQIDRAEAAVDRLSADLAERVREQTGARDDHYGTSGVN